MDGDDGEISPAVFLVREGKEREGGKMKRKKK